MSANNTTKPTLLPVKIFEEGPYFMVPRFLTAELMGSHHHYKGSNHKCERIPASFWKFFFYLWAWIMNGNPERATTQSMREFPVRGDAAVQWSAAISVSGLFDVEIGKYTAAHDKPTAYRYRVGATKEEWKIFIDALDLILVRNKKYLKGNTSAFKFALAMEVDTQRELAGFVKVNAKFLTGAASGEIRDSRGRLITEHDRAGKVVPNWWRNAKRQPMNDGHPRDCRCADCLAAREDMQAYLSDEKEAAMPRT